MKTKGWIGLAAAAGILCAGRSSWASDRDWKISSSLNYESGDYGTDTRSSSLYVPFTLKRYWGEGFGSLTLPYVSQTSDGRVRNVGGRPLKIGRGGGGGATHTESGLGDIVMRGGYTLVHDDPGPLDLAVVAKIKAPTADEDKGLGTGEFDAGVGLEFAKAVAPGWTALADLYYTSIGDPPGLDLNDQFAGDVGLSRLLQENLTLTVLLEASNALVSGETAPVDARAQLDLALNDQAGLFAGAMAGLSDGSADYGFSLGGSFRF